MTKVIIDTDPGTDDALALIMAMNSPDLEILGLTTVGGNATLADTTRNALRLLEHLGRVDIPVYRGAARPIRGKFHYGYYYHGSAALGVRLPSPKGRPRTQRAADYIVERARAHRGDLTVLALGPLTNIAAAIAKEPRMAEWVGEIVIMGGAVSGPGNVTPYAEFNTYNDPEAARIVLSSGVRATLVGLDVCDQVYVQGDDRWIQGQSESEKLARRILANWFASRSNAEPYSLCDPLAVVAALRPELFSLRQADVTVEVSDAEHMGQTSAAYGAGNVGVATAVRVDEAKDAIRTLLRGSTL
jgi:inosine-uridine nucleoside N-ribohydrolase